MRVTDKMLNDRLLQELQRNRSELLQRQEEASTQKKIRTWSHDPAQAARANLVKVQTARDEQMARNSSLAKSYLEATESALSEVGESLNRLKELALQQANDANASRDTRLLVAKEVEQIYKHILSVANRNFGERYLFSGAKVNQPPFSEGAYLGSGHELFAEIQPQQFVALNLPGNRVFSVGTPPISAESNITEDVDSPSLELSKTPHLDRAPDSDTSSSRSTSLFQVIRDFLLGLKINEKSYIQNSIDSIDQAFQHIQMLRAELGSRMRRLDDNIDFIRKTNIDQKAQVSELEDADLIEVVQGLHRADQSLKQVLETGARVVQPSLLQFLR